MSQSATRRRYRWIESDYDTGARERVLVVMHKGWEGYNIRWTAYCSGCTEYGDYGTRYGPTGCEECGYTGKRRRVQWMPFDAVAYQAHRDRVWERYTRLCTFVRDRQRRERVA